MHVKDKIYSVKSLSILVSVKAKYTLRSSFLRDCLRFTTYLKKSKGDLCEPEQCCLF